MLTWIVGSGGLLGSALSKHVQEANRFESPGFNWNAHELLTQQFDEAIKEFQQQAGQEPWCVIWAAGSATTSTDVPATAKELSAFKHFTETLRNLAPQGPGVFFLSSSAGGVYAGSSAPPFTDESQPIPLSAYGQLKLDQEQQAKEALKNTCPVIIGRISNLYGPGQNLEKLQGLISRLALSAITKEPITMFVSLDTIRDYIYTDDAAKVILALVEAQQKNAISNAGKNQASTVIIASGQPTSLGYLINMMQDVAHTKIPVAYGNHSSAGAQARDLRLMPTNAQQAETLVNTPLSAGVKNVYLDILNRYQLALSPR